MSERRQHPRHVVRLLVQHQSVPDEHPEVDYASDLSKGGLFITTTRPVAPKTTVHVQFAPARDSRLISAFVRVSHVTKSGFGAQFVSLDRDAEALLDSTLAEPGLVGAVLPQPGPPPRVSL